MHDKYSGRIVAWDEWTRFIVDMAVLLLGDITRLLIVSCLYLCAANQLSILSMYLDGEECYKGILPVVCCAGYKVMHMSDLLGKV